MWPKEVDMTKEECSKRLRKLELEAYAQVVSAFRAQGELTENKKNILRSLASEFGINGERHKAEIRRAYNSEDLYTIAHKVYNCNSDTTWSQEGRRSIPVIAHQAPQTAFFALANEVSSSHSNKPQPNIKEEAPNVNKPIASSLVNSNTISSFKVTNSQEVSSSTNPSPPSPNKYSNQLLLDVINHASPPNNIPNLISNSTLNKPSLPPPPPKVVLAQQQTAEVDMEVEEVLKKPLEVIKMVPQSNVSSTTKPVSAAQSYSFAVKLPMSHNVTLGSRNLISLKPMTSTNSKGTQLTTTALTRQPGIKASTSQTLQLTSNTIVTNQNTLSRKPMSVKIISSSNKFPKKGTPTSGAPRVVMASATRPISPATTISTRPPSPAIRQSLKVTLPPGATTGRQSVTGPNVILLQTNKKGFFTNPAQRIEGRATPNISFIKTTPVPQTSFETKKEVPFDLVHPNSLADDKVELTPTTYIVAKNGTTDVTDIKPKQTNHFELVGHPNTKRIYTIVEKSVPIVKQERPEMSSGYKILETIVQDTITTPALVKEVPSGEENIDTVPHPLGVLIEAANSSIVLGPSEDKPCDPGPLQTKSINRDKDNKGQQNTIPDGYDSNASTVSCDEEDDTFDRPSLDGELADDKPPSNPEESLSSVKVDKKDRESLDEIKNPSDIKEKYPNPFYSDISDDEGNSKACFQIKEEHSKTSSSSHAHVEPQIIVTQNDSNVGESFLLKKEEEPSVVDSNKSDDRPIIKKKEVSSEKAKFLDKVFGKCNTLPKDDLSKKCSENVNRESVQATETTKNKDCSKHSNESDNIKMHLKEEVKPSDENKKEEAKSSDKDKKEEAKHSNKDRKEEAKSSDKDKKEEFKHSNKDRKEEAKSSDKDRKESSKKCEQPVELKKSHEDHKDKQKKDLQDPYKMIVKSKEHSKKNKHKKHSHKSNKKDLDARSLKEALKISNKHKDGDKTDLKEVSQSSMKYHNKHKKHESKKYESLENNNKLKEGPKIKKEITKEKINGKLEEVNDRISTLKKIWNLPQKSDRKIKCLSFEEVLECNSRSNIKKEKNGIVKSKHSDSSAKIRDREASDDIEPALKKKKSNEYSDASRKDSIKRAQIDSDLSKIRHGAMEQAEKTKTLEASLHETVMPPPKIRTLAAKKYYGDAPPVEEYTLDPSSNVNNANVARQKQNSIPYNPESSINGSNGTLSLTEDRTENKMVQETNSHSYFKECSQMIPRVNYDPAPLQIMEEVLKTLTPTNLVVQDINPVISQEINISRIITPEIISPEVSQEVTSEVNQEVTAELNQEIVAEVNQEIVLEVDMEITTEVNQEITTEVNQEIVPESNQEISPEVNQEIIKETNQEVTTEITFEPSDTFAPRNEINNEILLNTHSDSPIETLASVVMDILKSKEIDQMNDIKSQEQSKAIKEDAIVDPILIDTTDIMTTPPEIKVTIENSNGHDIPHSEETIVETVLELPTSTEEESQSETKLELSQSDDPSPPQSTTEAFNIIQEPVVISKIFEDSEIMSKIIESQATGNVVVESNGVDITSVMKLEDLACQNIDSPQIFSDDSLSQGEATLTKPFDEENPLKRKLPSDDWKVAAIQHLESLQKNGLDLLLNTEVTSFLRSIKQKLELGEYGDINDLHEDIQIFQKSVDESSTSIDCKEALNFFQLQFVELTNTKRPRLT